MAKRKKKVVSETKIENVESVTTQTDEVVVEAPVEINVPTEVVNVVPKTPIDVSSFNSANKVSKNQDVAEPLEINTKDVKTQLDNDLKDTEKNEYIMPDKTFDKEANTKIMNKQYTVRTAFSMNMKRTAIKQTLTLDEIIRAALIYKNKFIGFVSTIDLDYVINILNTREILFEYHILTKKDIDFIIYRLKSNSEFAMKFPFRDD